MKNYLLLMLVVVMAFSLGACKCSGGDSNNELDLSNVKPHEIVESGYSIKWDSKDENWVISYGFLVKNPNEDVKIIYPTVRIIAKDKNGELLCSEDQSVGELAPKTIAANAGNGLYLSSKPDKVDFEIVKPDKDGYKKINSNEPELITLETDEVRTVSDEIKGEIITGEVKNDSDERYDKVEIVIIYRDENDKIVGGELWYEYDLEPNSKNTFEVYITSKSATDKFESYAYPWE